MALDYFGWFSTSIGIGRFWVVLGGLAGLHGVKWFPTALDFLYSLTVFFFFFGFLLIALYCYGIAFVIWNSFGLVWMVMDQFRIV